MHQINMQLPVQGDFLDFPAESLHDFLNFINFMIVKESGK